MSILSVYDPFTVRRRAIVRLLGCSGVFAVGLAILIPVTSWLGHEPTPEGLIPFALPGACALGALIELVTGVSFWEWSERWNELKGWQRGVLGTLIVLAAGAGVIVGVGSLFYLWSSFTPKHP